MTAAPVNAPDANGNMIGGTTSNTLINPRLAALANNGGPTRTHALMNESPAINRGDPAALPGAVGVPVNDQRGSPFTRVFGGRIDIGEFERQPTEIMLGDFNASGSVDGADYVMWRRAQGSTNDYAMLVDSRGNGDGVVDHWDRVLWMSNFGATHVALSQGVSTEALDVPAPRDASGAGCADRACSCSRCNFTHPAHHQPPRTLGRVRHTAG